MTSKTKSTSSSAVPAASDLPGDPNCPYCHGQGYLRTDLPVGDPEFGKLQVCVCRRARVANTVRERLFAISHLDELQHLTFETFKPRGQKGLPESQSASLEIALNQSHHYAETLEGWLLLQGGYGAGKTHLAAAIANYVVAMGVPTLFLTVPDLLDSLRFSYAGEDTSFEERFNDIRGARLLILDDFGTQNATPWAQEKLFQIINYRYINKLPTVITTNLDLDDIEPRIRSRLADPQLVTKTYISAPDFRQPAKESRQVQLSSLDLHSARTFESFSLRRDENLAEPALKSLKEACSAAQAFAQKPRGWLLITGDYGSGKTHLAAAVGNQRSQLGDPPLFVMVSDLLDYLRATFGAKSEVTFDRRFEEIRTTPLLVLDDLGAQSMTPWVREKLHQLFDYRYNAELPTVITVAADSLNDVDPRLRSRLLDARLCRIVGITAPAYHGKAAARKAHSPR